VSRRIRLALSGVVLAVALAACGSSSPGTSKASSSPTTVRPSAASFPVTIHGSSGDLTITKAPTHIVSMSPTATETLFAIGAGPQVVAVDKNSNYPSSAPKGTLDAYQPNVESIAATSPDLVVLSDPGKLLAPLQALKIPVLVEAAPADLDGMNRQFEELGMATGHVDGATSVVQKIKTGMASIVAGTHVQGLSYYYELDNTLYSQTSRTFLGTLLGQLGLVNIADRAQATGDYPQLSAEYIVKADPDLILLADTKCCQQSRTTVAARAGWGTMKAVRGSGVVELDDDIASRWGPRVVDLLRGVASAATKVKAGT
jgi:iron complex transport system substrate-binding protein